MSLAIFTSRDCNPPIHSVDGEFVYLIAATNNRHQYHVSKHLQPHAYILVDLLCVWEVIAWVVPSIVSDSLAVLIELAPFPAQTLANNYQYHLLVQVAINV